MVHTVRKRIKFMNNKTDNLSSFSKKSTKRIGENNQKRKSLILTNENFNPKITTPAVDIAFKAFLSARFCSAVWSFITDCDETFNYWEPLHYIIYGTGLQTWEYSPKFAIRSYTYLMIHGVPAWIYNKIVNSSPLFLFYFIRCVLALQCAVVECYLYKSICREFGIHIGRMWLVFQLCSTGMFISSTALLPSSFSMIFGNAALSAWWCQKYRLAIFFTAISALLGWPFAAVIGLPIAIEMIFRQKMVKTFILWTLISGLTILIPMILIDSSYYGKLTIAPLNIVIYNMFTDHGPNLYGTEPLSYYLINGFLNFNINWIFSLITPLAIIIDYYFVPSKSKNTLNYPYYLSLLPLYLWLMIFGLQPHKEERFLFPIYPLINLCGSITLDIIQKLIFRIKDKLFNQIKNGSHYLNHTMFIAIIVMTISSLLGISRIFALHYNYHAPMDIFMELNNFKNSQQYSNNQIYNVCIGKDWYRYPSSFFLPNTNFRIRFLKSEFKGILPAYYSNDINATSIIHSYFNDLNQENDYMYFNYTKCHFLIDLDIGKTTELEPNYSANSKEWIIMKSLKYLDHDNSHKLLRAFYIPFLSDKFLKYGNLNLLKRKEFKFI